MHLGNAERRIEDGNERGRTAKRKKIDQTGRGRIHLDFFETIDPREKKSHEYSTHQLHVMASTQLEIRPNSQFPCYLTFIPNVDLSQTKFPMNASPTQLKLCVL